MQVEPHVFAQYPMETKVLLLRQAELNRQRREQAAKEPAGNITDADLAQFRYSPALENFDFRYPEYGPVLQERAERLSRLRARPALIKPLKVYYAAHPADFITDWGVTFEPRNAEINQPTLVPFILFQRQREFVEYVLRKWRERRRGLGDKSRDSGVSWLAVSMSATLCLFIDGMIIGFGSRLEEYVDKLGEPKSLFEKARIFLENLPAEFLGGWTRREHAPHMRIIFPGSRSLMSGEGGDNIGRGNRTAIYFVDEAAHLMRPALAEAALSNTTNCRVDISTPNGLGNPFEQNRHSGKIEVFTFHWRDDPRKDDAWYAKQVEEAFAPSVVAQEVDIDYAASVEGVLIPHAWAMAAVGAHEKLNIAPTGRRVAALDVADEGQDLNALCVSQGVVIEELEEWTGRGADIFDTVERSFRLCESHNLIELRYDSDGLGAGVRGDARILNQRRLEAGYRPLEVVAFRGSEKPHNPEGQDVKGRKNKDFFANRKAQAWWSLRVRFLNTYRWISEGIACHPDDIISIRSDLPNRLKLTAELSQPTFSTNTLGKVVIDKSPEGTRSPNLADAVMIKFASVATPMVISPMVLERARLPQNAGTRMMPAALPTQQPSSVGGGWNIGAALLQRARRGS